MRAWVDTHVDKEGLPLEDVLKELNRFSELYLRIAHPEQVAQSPAIAEQLRRLNVWEVSVAYPFVLHAMDLATRAPAPVISDEELLTVLRMLESFVVRRLVTGIPTNRLRRIFARMPRQVTDLDFVTSCSRYLLENDWPTDELFVERFQTNPLYQNARVDRVRQILVSLERQLGGKEQVAITPTITVEHVMPQTLAESRPTLLRRVTWRDAGDGPCQRWSFGSRIHSRPDAGDWPARPIHCPLEVTVDLLAVTLLGFKFSGTLALGVVIAVVVVALGLIWFARTRQRRR